MENLQAGKECQPSMQWPSRSTEHLQLGQNGHITSMHFMHINAAFPSVAKGTLLNLKKVRQLDLDHGQWTESILSERMVEKIAMSNSMNRY